VVSAIRVLASLVRSLLLYGRLKFVGCLADPSQLEIVEKRTQLEDKCCSSALWRCLTLLSALFSVAGVHHLFKASYLVDLSSSHMLVSKIKPCMSKYKPH
jgi:hypothetical protein